MPFMDITLPAKLSFGTGSGASFQTDVVTYQGGGEYRNSRWDYQKATFDVSYVVKDRADANKMYKFFLTAQGRFNSFRVKDELDYTSAEDGVSTPTAQDQFIAIADGSSLSFQLIKAYSNGLTSYTRRITKPVDNGAVKVAVNGVETTNFTLDYVTGILTLGFPPTAGHIITAGYEFSIHCRFENDSIEGIEYVLLRPDSSRDHFSFPPLQIVEVLD